MRDFKAALQKGLSGQLRRVQAEAAAAVMSAALAAADPHAAVVRSLHCQDGRLEVGQNTFHLADYQRVKVLAIGKAALAMTEGARCVLDDYLTGGLVVCKHLDPTAIGQLPGCIVVTAGNHPIPGEDSLQAGRQVAELLAGGAETDLVLCLLSGGGSALVTWPQVGVSLADMQTLTRQLLACGAAIEEINCLRKHLDRIKGGGLARLAAPARLVTLVLSDVVGSPLDVIASGPTVADPTSFADALAILQKYGLTEKVPQSVLQTLKSGAAGNLPETPKAGDQVLEHAMTWLAGDNYQAAQAAVHKARELGFQTLLMSTWLQGEAREAGGMLAAILRQMALSGEPLPRPACLIFGGETTVTLRGRGLGGRNQELALGAVRGLAGLPDVLLAALGTDGEDGPTDAAGAFVTGQTHSAAQQQGLSSAAFLAENDAYHYFDALQGLLHTGPTGTNVNDLTFLFAF